MMRVIFYATIYYCLIILILILESETIADILLKYNIKAAFQPHFQLSQSTVNSKTLQNVLKYYNLHRPQNFLYGCN